MLLVFIFFTIFFFWCVQGWCVWMVCGPSIDYRVYLFLPAPLLFNKQDLWCSERLPVLCFVRFVSSSLHETRFCHVLNDGHVWNVDTPHDTVRRVFNVLLSSVLLILFLNQIFVLQGLGYLKDLFFFKVDLFQRFFSLMLIVIVAPWRYPNQSTSQLVLQSCVQSFTFNPIFILQGLGYFKTLFVLKVDLLIHV